MYSNFNTGKSDGKRKVSAQCEEVSHTAASLVQEE